MRWRPWLMTRKCVAERIAAIADGWKISNQEDFHQCRQLEGVWSGLMPLLTATRCEARTVANTDNQSMKICKSWARSLCVTIACHHNNDMKWL
ncbi:nuclear receptor subfamily 5 group a member 2 [Plakobranchus ocellatus]|uniref:Nuclear receptor subfamily 5 group a member 2 n=1 Tax=Plakobranchus ocellatus TaxID=259542 RepID=A0AAV3ZCT0_9GAST|nr:nuclear receptor subfamily 5 group a member 2 [Plakobranchus ocellatus]